MFCLCTTCVPSTSRPRSGHWMPRNWGYILSAHVRVLGIRIESSERVNGALNHWVNLKSSEPVSLIGVTYNCVGEKLLIDAQTTQWKVHHTVGWWLMKLETLGSLHSWRDFKGDWECLSNHEVHPPGGLSCLVQATWLLSACWMVWAPSVQFSYLSVSAVLRDYICLRGRALVNLSSFRDFLKLLNFLFLCFGIFSAEWSISPPFLYWQSSVMILQDCISYISDTLKQQNYRYEETKQFYDWVLHNMMKCIKGFQHQEGWELLL